MNKNSYQTRRACHLDAEQIASQYIRQPVMSHLETSAKWGARNRAQFASRQILRIQGNFVLQVSDVLGLNGVVRGRYIAEDSIVCLLDDHLKDELHR